MIHHAQNKVLKENLRNKKKIIPIIITNIQQRKYTLLTSFLFHRLTVLFINNLPFPSVQKVFQKENRHYNKIFSK